MKLYNFFALPIIILLLVGSCGTTTQGEKEGSSISKKGGEKATIDLNQELFLKKIFDYKSESEEWNYLGDKPAIIDFWADWCVYCRKISPLLEELAKEYEGKIYIYKVNTNKEREIAQTLGIRSLPSLLFIPLEGSPQLAEGALPKAELKRVIDEILLKVNEQ